MVSSGAIVETPLTPLEFQRRARSLYADREAVIDGSLQLTYAEFFARCDRWSAALQKLGVRKGDRVAYVAPNTHAQLESFYAVPQIGAVLVPINFRLTPEEIAYIIGHSGAKVVCAHADYLEAVDSGRGDCPDVEHLVALEGAREGWLDYEALLGAEAPVFEAAEVDESDLLTINYTSGTTSRPKGVMITHRNAWANVVGTLVHWPMNCGTRYLWTLPMFHANGWTFTWVVTAVGGAHICLRAVDPPALGFRLMRRRVGHAHVRGPDRADHAGQRARRGAGRGPARRQGDDRRCAPGRRDHSAARRRVRVGADPRLRPDRDGAVHHGLRAPARASRSLGRRAGHRQGTAGSRADHLGRAAGRRRRRQRSAPATRRRWAKSSYAATSSPPATTTIRRRRPRRCAAAGSTAATPRSSTRTATSRSATASRMSSSAAGRTSPRSRSKG